MGAYAAKPSNKDMVDRLASSLASPEVEAAFRAVDRGMYYEFEDGENTDPYNGDPWRRGNLHISAPCIYAQVVEALNLKSGLSFLNLGSGTGYLNTLVGLLIGPNGINHGIECRQDVVDYAREKLQKFKSESFAVDKFDFSEPIFVTGNCLNLNPDSKYDRIYLGAACMPEVENFMKSLVKPDGGILIMPFGHHLKRYIRNSDNDWTIEKLMDVNFTQMIMEREDDNIINMPLDQPKRLMELSRVAIRRRLREKTNEMNPNLKYRDNYRARRQRRKKEQLKRLRLSENLRKSSWRKKCDLLSSKSEPGDHVGSYSGCTKATNSKKTSSDINEPVQLGPSASQEIDSSHMKARSTVRRMQSEGATLSGLMDIKSKLKRTTCTDLRCRRDSSQTVTISYHDFYDDDEDDNDDDEDDEDDEDENENGHAQDDDDDDGNDTTETRDNETPNPSHDNVPNRVDGSDLDDDFESNQLVRRIGSAIDQCARTRPVHRALRMRSRAQTALMDRLIQQSRLGIGSLQRRVFPERTFTSRCILRGRPGVYLNRYGTAKIEFPFVTMSDDRQLSSTPESSPSLISDDSYGENVSNLEEPNQSETRRASYRYIAGLLAGENDDDDDDDDEDDDDDDEDDDDDDDDNDDDNNEGSGCDVNPADDVSETRSMSRYSVIGDDDDEEFGSSNRKRKREYSPSESSEDLSTAPPFNRRTSIFSPELAELTEPSSSSNINQLNLSRTEAPKPPETPAPSNKITRPQSSNWSDDTTQSSIFAQSLAGHSGLGERSINLSVAVMYSTDSESDEQVHAASSLRKPHNIKSTRRDSPREAALGSGLAVRRTKFQAKMEELKKMRSSDGRSCGGSEQQLATQPITSENSTLNVCRSTLGRFSIPYSLETARVRGNLKRLEARDQARDRLLASARKRVRSGCCSDCANCAPITSNRLSSNDLSSSSSPAENRRKQCNKGRNKTYNSRHCSGCKTKRIRASECERYHQHLYALISRLPIPPVLHSYLNYDRRTLTDAQSL